LLESLIIGVVRLMRMIPGLRFLLFGSSLELDLSINHLLLWNRVHQIWGYPSALWSFHCL